MGNKVLLVDDDSEILSLVQYALEAAGHQVQVCDNGREVLETMLNYKPELLITRESKYNESPVASGISTPSLSHA